MTQFRDGFYELCPPWLRTGNAEKYLYSLELMRDLLMEKCNQAIKIRLPGQGDISQIPYLAFDRQLVQGPLESDASFIIRLKNAIPTWNKAGSAFAVLTQLKAYTQGIQPDETRRKFVIVSNPRTLHGAIVVNTWFTVAYDDTMDMDPVQSRVLQNFDWDGGPETWRDWLVIHQYRDDAQATGTGAALGAASGGSFTEPGQLVDGVWVPTTSGTPVNAPFVTVTGLSGLLPSNVGSILTLSGGDPANTGHWQIAEVLSATSCIIVNPDNVTPDTGLVWSLATFPWMPPGPAWGTPFYVFGQGEDEPPDEDTGSNVRGIWKPTTFGGTGKLPTISWGLSVNTLEIQTLRGLVKQWKSASTYYPNIIIAYDGPEPVGAYSRLSDEGTGNPDGTFGPVGSLVDGVWVPTRLISSPWDCYCQGTGVANACSKENIT